MTDKAEPGLDGAYALTGPDDARRMYAAWADTYDTDFATRTGYRFARRAAELFVAAGGVGPVLDIGCGTGLIADDLPDDLIVDGVDLSPEMLAVARQKGRYRRLIEADLTQPLAVSESYGGLVSAGTFTHGHVPPSVFPPLLSHVAPQGIVVITSRTDFMVTAGFDRVIDTLVHEGRISAPAIVEELVYDGPEAPEGHSDDLGLLLTFRRL